SAQQDDSVLPCDCGEGLRRRARNFFRKAERGRIIGALAKVMTAKKFRQGDNLGPLAGRLADAVHRLDQIVGGRAVAPNLNEAHRHDSPRLHASLHGNVCSHWEAKVSDCQIAAISIWQPDNLSPSLDKIGSL